MECHIHKIPVELTEWVAEFLDRDDLLNFRTTCRDIAAKLERVVIRECFTEYSCMLSDLYGLSPLCEISKHKVYSKTIRHIRLSLERMGTWNEYVNFLQARRFVNNDGPAERRKYEKQHEELSLHYRIYEGGKGLDVKHSILLEILRNFMAAHNFPAISAEHRVPDCRRPELGVFKVNDRDDTLYVELVKCLVLADYPVTHLKLGSMQHPLPTWVINRYSKQFFIDRLRSLDLTLIPDLRLAEQKHPYYGPLHGYHEEAYSNKFIVRLLRGATKLEKLHLAANDSHYSKGYHVKIFAMIARECLGGPDRNPRCTTTLRHLKDLKLVNQKVPSDDLLAFINQHHESLRRIELHRLAYKNVPRPSFEADLQHALTDGDRAVVICKCYEPHLMRHEEDALYDNTEQLRHILQPGGILTDRTQPCCRRMHRHGENCT